MWFICSTAAAAVKQLEGPSDLPQTSSTVLDQSPLIMSSPPTPASMGKHIPYFRQDFYFRSLTAGRKLNLRKILKT